MFYKTCARMRPRDSAPSRHGGRGSQTHRIDLQGPHDMGLLPRTLGTMLSSNTFAGYGMAKGRRPLQSPGLISKVYVPILLDIFNARYRQGASTIIFSLDDIRNTADRLKLETRNPADVVYRMRSRTLLPKGDSRQGLLRLALDRTRPVSVRKGDKYDFRAGRQRNYRRYRYHSVTRAAIAARDYG